MPRTAPHPRARIALAVVGALAVGAVVPTAAQAQDGAGLSGATGLGEVAQTLTLLTGDVVTVTDAGDGRRAVSVAPGEGRDRVLFQSTEVDGELLVIPSDVVPYLASGVLDRDLFDVTTLLADGYDDLDTLPLIAAYSHPDDARTSAIDATETTATLPSIGGASLAADTGRLTEVWRSLTPGASIAATPEEGAVATLAGGISHLWLDGKVSADLEQSVAQTGAPTAWAAGYEGAGVEVAVLDTGVDATHPDLANRITESRDFSESSGGIADRVGHGTHVASTIAGTGAGSDGRERGVAPAASLLIGKVLGDDGSGYDSWVIAGMEWAVDEGAAVVNMSLGGPPSDGTEPIDLALDRLSEESGTLFVVAAGNEGTTGSVGSPGSASAALTVGAVDADGALAEFSSRGPRVGDDALKPEITAPGVDIVAARAAGTAMGTPVDDLYTSASGTSMATPHVAGAAALLVQQHPDWSAPQLKAALVNSTMPTAGLSVWEQGAGQLDVARAVDQDVTATPVADFARVTADGVGTRTVVYRNDGEADAVLDLRLDLVDVDDPRLTTDAVSLPTRVTVPAGGTAEVAVALDGAALDRGRWSGAVVATDAGGLSVRTAVGAIKAGPLHRVTVRAVGFDGEDTGAPVMTLIGDHPGTEWIQYVSPGDPLQMDVEEGSYLLHAIVYHYDPQDERIPEIVDPNIEVTGDMEIVLDARTTRRIDIETPEPAQQQADHSYYAHRVYPNGRSVSHGVMGFGEYSVWVSPTAPVVDGSFEFSSRWQLVRPSALVSVRGMSETPLVNLLPQSPVFDRTRTLRLAATDSGLAGVAGRVAILRVGEDDDEKSLTAAAAAAGAEAVIFVRPPEYGIRTVFHPEGDRDPIPAMITTSIDGERMLQLAAAGRTTVSMDLRRSSPYLYDVQQVSESAIPDGIVYRVSHENSHRIRTTYQDTGEARWIDEQRFGWRPWQTYAWNDGRRLVATPSVREEWVTSGDSVWQHRVSHDHNPWDWGALQGGMTTLPRSYEPGRSAESWNRPVIRQGAIAGAPSTRTGDLVQLRVADFVDADGHYSLGETTTGSARLFRGDELVWEGRVGVADVPVPGEAAGYRLETDATRIDPGWRWTPQTTTTWWFSSVRPDSGTTTGLPLLQVAYRAPVDASGFAPRRVHVLRIDVTGADGAPLRDSSPRVELSSDSGGTWTAAKVIRIGATTVVVVPRGTAPVSVRVDATAPDGTRVLQTVVDAYGRG